MGIIVLIAMGFYGSSERGGIYMNPDSTSEVFYGMAEYSIALVVLGLIYGEKFRSRQSDDAAFLVGFTIWSVGLAIALPGRLLLYLFGIFRTSWISGFPILFLYMFGLPYAVKRFKMY